MAEVSLYPSTWPAYVWLSLVVALPAVTLLYDFVVWLRMPPGPTPLPFIGNKLQLSQSKPWIQFHEWSKIYGPIYTIWIGRCPTIILSDPVVAADLLESRSSKYSSRPRMVAVCGISPLSRARPLLSKTHGLGNMERRFNVSGANHWEFLCRSHTDREFHIIDG